MFKEISTKDIKENAFDLIGNEWMLVAARKADGSVNAMTASWGGFGVMWGKDVAFVVIRQTRYTKEFMDEAKAFSLSFFDESYKEMLGYMGKISGRNEDKIAKCKLNVNGNIPIFNESRMTLVCKSMFAQILEEDSFLSKEALDKWYPDKNMHTLYIAEIEKAIVRE